MQLVALLMLAAALNGQGAVRGKLNPWLGFVAIYDTSSPPSAVASCLTGVLKGTETEAAGDATIVRLRDGVGNNLVSWSISPNGSGSHVEAQRSPLLTMGIARADTCFS